LDFTHEGRAEQVVPADAATSAPYLLVAIGPLWLHSALGGTAVMTVEEAIARANDPDHQDSNTPAVRQWLLRASSQDICRFIHGLSVGRNERYLPAARASLDVRLSEDTVKQSETLRHQVASLVGIAEAQRALAVKLERQTNKIIALTWALLLFTVALLVHEVIKEHFRPHAETNFHHAEPSPKR
jgi:hypothetical protein